MGDTFIPSGPIPAPITVVVYREEEVATGPDGEFVGEFDTNRSVLIGNNYRTQVMECADRRISRICLPVSPERRIGQIGMHFCVILSQLDLVIIRTRDRSLVSGIATGMYCPRLFAPAAFRPGSVSTNFRIPLVNGPPRIAVAAAFDPVASVMMTTGAE